MVISEFISLSDSSQILIFQADTPFDSSEIQPLKEKMYQFTNNWVSHGQHHRAYAGIFHLNFLVFAVEGELGGCSKDACSNFVGSIGNSFQKDMFRADIFKYLDEEAVVSISMQEMSDAFANNNIKEDTLFFDNLVKSKGDYLENWLKPLGSSWHKRFI